MKTQTRKKCLIISFFSKVIKPSLSDNSRVKEEINLVGKEEILKIDLETAEVLNTVFRNIVKNNEIDQYSNFDPVINNVKDPTFRAILKYKDNSTILAIENN